MPIAAPHTYAFDVERGDDRRGTGHDVAADDHGAGAERLRDAVGDERGEGAADRAGREQQPEPRVAGVEDAQREQHERRFDRGGAEVRDRTEPGQAAQHGVVAEEVPSTGEVLAHRRDDPRVGTHPLGAERSRSSRRRVPRRRRTTSASSPNGSQTAHVNSSAPSAGPSSSFAVDSLAMSRPLARSSCSIGTMFGTTPAAAGSNSVSPHASTKITSHTTAISPPPIATVIASIATITARSASTPTITRRRS